MVDAPAAVSSSHGTNDANVILFIFVCAGLGAATRHLLNQTIVPYTVIQFAIGLVAGIIGRAAPTFDKEYLTIARIDPHLIFFIFLPILIVASAINVHLYTFKKVFKQCLVLAGPGVLIGAFLFALVAKYIFWYYQWDWTTSILFGCISAATDPVAVVALLKELGTSRTIATLIEGEALLNDGTAIVLFSIFHESVKTGEINNNVGAILWQFLYVSLGGPAFGALTGFLTSFWLSRVFNDPLVEVTATISCSYLTFYFAEELKISGVLALVAFGAVLNAYRTNISPEVEKFMLEFWETAEYLANTILFILAGLVTSLVSPSFDWRDYVLLVILWICANLIRIFITYLFEPILSRLGPRVGWKNSAMISWGGIRGAVGLALALIVAADSDIAAREGGTLLQSRMLFQCSGIVVLTLVVNGISVKYLIKLLGLNEIPLTRRLGMRKTIADLIREKEKHISALAVHRFFSDSNWAEVRKRTNLENPYEADISNYCSANAIASHKMEAARQHCLKAFKGRVWHQYEEGLLRQKAVRQLVYLADDAIEEGKQACINPIEILKTCRVPKFVSKLATWPIIGHIMPVVTNALWASGFDIGYGFVVAQEEVADLLATFVEDADTISQLKGTLNKSKEMVVEELQSMSQQDPTHVEVTTSIKTRQAARAVLNTGRHYVSQLYHGGLLESSETERLVECLEQKMKALVKVPSRLPLAKPEDILRAVRWFKAAGPDTQARLIRSASLLMFKAGQDVIRIRARSDGIYVITKGIAYVSSPVFRDFLGPGTVLGEIGVLVKAPRTANVRAYTDLSAYFIATEDLVSAMDFSEALSVELWLTAGIRIAANILARTAPYNTWGRAKLARHCGSGELLSPLERGQEEIVYSENHLYILLYGKCFVTSNDESTNNTKQLNTRRQIKAPCIVPRAPTVAIFKDTRMMVLPDEGTTSSNKNDSQPPATQHDPKQHAVGHGHTFGALRAHAREQEMTVEVAERFDSDDEDGAHGYLNDKISEIGWQDNSDTAPPTLRKLLTGLTSTTGPGSCRESPSINQSGNVKKFVGDHMISADSDKVTTTTTTTTTVVPIAGMVPLQQQLNEIVRQMNRGELVTKNNIEVLQSQVNELNERLANVEQKLQWKNPGSGDDMNAAAIISAIESLPGGVGY